MPGPFARASAMSKRSIGLELSSLEANGSTHRGPAVLRHLRKAVTDEPPDCLNAYQRVTVAQWARNHARLSRQRKRTWPAWAAAHLLGGALRTVSDRAALVVRYEAGPVNDCALIHELLPALEPFADEIDRVRDTAFYLRWQELPIGGR